MKTLVKTGFLAVGVLGATLSQAAAIDVAAVVTDIGAQAAPVALVGGAVLILHLGIKAFRWIRGAMS